MKVCTKPGCGVEHEKNHSWCGPCQNADRQARRRGVVNPRPKGEDGVKAVPVEEVVIEEPPVAASLPAQVASIRLDAARAALAAGEQKAKVPVPVTWGRPKPPVSSASEVTAENRDAVRAWTQRYGPIGDPDSQEDQYSGSESRGRSVNMRPVTLAREFREPIVKAVKKPKKSFR